MNINKYKLLVRAEALTANFLMIVAIALLLLVGMLPRFLHTYTSTVIKGSLE